MSDSNKVSFRLSPALQAALAAHVRQHGGHMSDILREALEAYLGLRPTKRPTAWAPLSDTSDTVSDLAARVNALVADIARLQERLERLAACVAVAQIEASFHAQGEACQLYAYAHEVFEVHWPPRCEECRGAE